MTSLPLFAFEGDSLTAGAGAVAGMSWPLQVERTLDQRVRLHTAAVSSRTLATMLTEAATFDANLTGVGYAFGWAGTNDLYFGATASEVIDRYETWCAGRQAAGWKVVAFTLTPRSNAGTPGSFETDRQTVNTSIRANWATYADALVDLAADSRIGDDGDETDTTYYTDLVHMTSAGYTVVAELVKAQLRAEFGIE